MSLQKLIGQDLYELSKYYDAKGDKDKSEKFMSIASINNNAKALKSLADNQENPEVKHNLNFKANMYTTRKKDHYQIAKFHQTVTKNQKLMVRYFKVAAKKGNVDAMIELSGYYDNKGKREKMLKYLRMGAERGDITCITNMGSYYYSIENHHEALTYFVMAYNINKQDPDSCFNLAAYMYNCDKYKESIKYFMETLKNIKNGDEDTKNSVLSFLKELKNNEEVSIMYVQELEKNIDQDIYKEQMQYFINLEKEK
jgi:TPR repeat protein